MCQVRQSYTLTSTCGSSIWSRELAVAGELDVPYKRLLTRFHGRLSKSTRPPTNRKLTEEQQSALCRYLGTLGEMYTSATRKQCHATTKSLARSHGSKLGSLPTVRKL
ncbi:hypothetical protein K432DRAFT_299703 [Lepidopterella palustris CBS 459.81]|uniref:Uncharacterized protein n=1 Tax=Lepidopterella palustris CBS 459.81 TaxID=1314670 RepID=A0A8E2JEB7_9PEZI|nr:hypothetical protein K432DRAFT_299703 [Lepidopterella palustris CBS 459.81]